MPLDDAGVPVPDTAHIGSAAADVFYLVNLKHLPLIKDDLQGPQSAVLTETDIDRHIPFFSLYHQAASLRCVKVPYRVNIVVIVGIYPAENRVGVHHGPLHTAVAVPLAQYIYRTVDMLQLFALFLIGEKAELNRAILRD